MGITDVDVHFLASAKKSGIPFSSVLTLGRLNIFCSMDILKSIVNDHLKTTINKKEKNSNNHNYYSEELFKILGVLEIKSMDFSDYEGADFVHDLNLPIGSELRERFDIVYDGGTLEHVFNFPVSIKNAMMMVKLNGSLMMNTPINNLCGHGFYQFSPELLFRIFSEENGFRIVRMMIHRGGKYYSVSDPAELKSRVTLINKSPTSLLVHAQRINTEAEIFSIPPQQSDYKVMWNSGSDSDISIEDSLIKSIARKFLSKNQVNFFSYYMNIVRKKYAIFIAERNSALSNKKFYKIDSIYGNMKRDDD